jgi:alpha-aminoadipate/glutamate carrier protein LysW
MPTSVCPECDEEVYVDSDSEQGDQVSCDECGTSLVIVGLDPIELDVADEKVVGNVEEEDMEAFDY